MIVVMEKGYATRAGAKRHSQARIGFRLPTAPASRMFDLVLPRSRLRG